MAVVGRNAAGQVTINGTPTFIRLIYDSGFAGSGGTDMAGHIAARNLSRFTNKLNVYLHVQSATFGNGLRLCDALAPLNMYALAVGNAFGGATVEQMSSGNGNFDVVVNPTYTTSPEGTGPFRTLFAAKPRSIGVYLSDEVTDNVTLQDNLTLWNSNYKTAMPNLATMSIFVQNPTYQYLSFGPLPTGEWMGADPYPIGTAAETALPANITWGYMNFEVGEAAAGARYHALLNGKSPIVILQAFKFGSASRFITNAELWSHMVAVVAEGCVGIGWWAMGVQAGALDTAQVPSTERTRILDQLDTMSTLLASLEPVLLSPSNPALLTSNSTSTGNARTWRIALCNVLRNQGGDRPCWLFSEAQRFQDEWSRLNLATPDTTLSNHMLDQSGNVRTRCWESGGFGYVFAYNIHPDAQTNVTLQWHSTVTRVEVLGEARDVPVTGGRSWTDTYGGSSSLRQGAFNQGHVYRLTLTTSQAYSLSLNSATYTVTGADVTAVQGSGPTLIGFVHRT